MLCGRAVKHSSRHRSRRPFWPVRTRRPRRSTKLRTAGMTMIGSGRGSIGTCSFPAGTTGCSFGSRGGLTVWLFGLLALFLYWF